MTGPTSGSGQTTGSGPGPGRRWAAGDLEALRKVRDPHADDVAREHYSEEDRPANHLFRALVSTEQPGAAGESIGRYLAEQPPVPGWVDRATIDRAQDWFVRVWSHVFCALYAGSLPSAYACHQGVEVLHRTAQLETNAKRRLNETAQFILDVMRPGGLEPGGAGYQAARKVRLMHAGVRWLIEHQERAVWDRDLLGDPINQEDLLLTLLTFTEVVFEVFDRTGVEYSDQEAADYIHLWSWVGCLLGVEEKQLPLDRAATIELMEHVRTVHYGPSEAGRVLTAALLDQASGLLPPGVRGLPAAAVRWYIGDEAADFIAVPRADWTKALFGPLAAVTRVMSATPLHQGMLRGFSDRFGRAMLTLAVTAERGGDRASFSIPEELAARGVTPGRQAAGRRT